MKTLLTILFLAFSTIAFSQKVRIAAAANVRYAMDDILQSYKNINPNIDIEIIYGASGNIYSQISNGAPYDMFFSADVNFPERLHKEGLSINEPKVYAEGRLVLWSLTIDVSSGLRF